MTMHSSAKFACLTAVAVAFAAFSPAAFAGPSCNTAVDSPSDGRSLAPYSQAKFKSLIDNTRSLQVQDTGTCITKAKMQGYEYDTDNWRLVGTNMEFKFTNGAKGERVELRGESFAGNLSKTLSGNVKVSVASQSPGFTIAQIFGEDTSDPILRVEMIGDRNGVKNHLWGIYRTGTGRAAVEYKDLGATPESGPQSLKLEYNRNGAITAKLGRNPTQTWKTNLSFWTSSKKSTYFKAGCYLQDAGSCRVLYTQLSY